MEPIVLRVNTCPWCRHFSTTDVSEFFVHLKLHDCFAGDCAHPKNFNGICKRAKAVTFRCPVPRCPRHLQGIYDLLDHVWNRHHNCRTCGFKNHRCICRRDVPSHIQVGGGPIIEVDHDAVEVNPAVQEVDPAAQEEDHAAQEQNVVEENDDQAENVVADPPVAIMDNIIREIVTPRNAEELPGPSRPRPPNERQVDDDERAAYLRIRDRWCPYCPLGFPDRESCNRHCVNAHPESCQEMECEDTADPLNLYLARSALSDTYRVYEVNLDEIEVDDINALFMAIKKQYLKLTKKILKRYRNAKMQFRLKCQFFREDAGVITHAFVPMESFNFLIENRHYANFAFNMALANYNVRIEDFQENGSGWRFQRLNEFSILFSEYRPFVGSGTIELPKELQKKKEALVNVPSHDELCFLRCLIAAMYKHEIPGGGINKRSKINKAIAKKMQENKENETGIIRDKLLSNPGKNKKRTLERIKFYNDRMDRIYKDLNLDGIKFPFNVKQGDKFERQNKDIGLNIFVYDERPESVDVENPKNIASLVPDEEKADETLRREKKKKHQAKMNNYEHLRQNVYPIKICKEERKIVVDIMLVQNGDEGHYILIDSLLSLLRRPNSSQRFICKFCLQTFDKMAETHQALCAALGRMRTSFPEEKILEWRKYQNTIPQQFLGAMDFESRLVPINIVKGNTRKVKKHKASAYAWAIINGGGKRINSNEYAAFDDAEDVAEQMLTELLKEAEKVAKQVKSWNEEANKVARKSNSKAPPLTGKETCKFCDEPIFGDGKRFVRHHEHYPPYEFQFYAHADCNKLAVTQEKLVVICHNMRSYDSHFLIKACAKKSIKYEVEVIGTSSEKFFVIFLGPHLMFIDSLNFFSASLEAVVKSMDPLVDFPISRQYFMEKYNDESKVELMLRKGIYPYDYISDLSKYDETKLPPPEAFFDSLSNRPVNPEDYEHATKVWDEFGVEDLRGYTKLYNISDVLLLLDCFQKLRSVFQIQFGLDPAHYFSLPHLSWESCMKHTKAKLELMTDETMLPWLETAMRGGVATGLEYRAAKANNPLLPDYDPKKPTSYIIVHDVNNLYGNCLVNYLPAGTFTWLEEEEIDEISKNPKDFIDQVPDEGNKGYYLEVDLHFPKEIHERLQGLTPVPYKRATDFEEYSPNMQELAIKLGVGDSAYKTSRLLADLHPRKNYVVHYRVLKFYLSLGIQITKIHRGISFLQEPVFRDYILRLASLRGKAKTKFEQNMWKLAANSIYGKSVECTRNRCRFVIVKDREKALRYNRKPNVSQVILLDSDKEGEDIAVIRLKKLSVMLDKPTYLGITVLDEAKRILYEWFYNYAQPKYGDRIHTLATDTDSVISLIETENIYKDMYEDKHIYDMSDYDPKHEFWKQFYCDENKKKLGKMKDENCNKTISSFIYLRPKMYMYDIVSVDGVDMAGNNKFAMDEVKKAKGLNRSAVKQQLNKETYLEALLNPIQRKVECNSIRSERHELYTVVLSKRGLSSFEQKRYVLPDGIHTLPFGHEWIAHEDNMPRSKKPRLEEDIEMDVNV